MNKEMQAKILAKIKETDEFSEGYPERLKGTKCWMWPGAWGAGRYGYMWHNGKFCRAHNISFAAFKGEIPKGLFVLHECQNKWCVNPDHLHLGTAEGNKDEEIALQARLEEWDVQEIRQYIAEDIYTLREIARRYKVSNETISAIKAGRIWGWLPRWRMWVEPYDDFTLPWPNSRE
jgi:hypothetical protein